MLETWVVGANQSAGKHNRDIFSIFFHMKVFYVFSLELPHAGDSNGYTQHTIFNIKKKITQNYFKYNDICSFEIFGLVLKNKFETAMVNEPSVFKPLKFHCIKSENSGSFGIKGAHERNKVADSV